ncbi:MAG: amino acid transporter [Saprospiraceae bacterium]|jgi:amino acid transporter
MSQATKKFGTSPVFFTAISTILGAVLFLRFGFAVGTVGFMGTVAIILIGHLVTVPTAMSIAEIATNQKVEGGGEYFIISRSFGLVIGSSIGLALYISQAISVAFYIIAFAEAFSSLFDWLSSNYSLHPTLQWLIEKKQTVSIPALIFLTVIVLTKGADLGVKALYFVVFILFISIISFFLGTTDYSQTHEFDYFSTVFNDSPPVEDTLAELPSPPLSDSSILEFNETILNPQTSSPIPSDPTVPAAISFFTVFAIIFPAFTGMTAGVGLSGDLEKPSRSIPLGTLAGTLTGMVVYLFIAWKLSVSASPADLANTENLVMGQIAIQGWWLIPLGLAAATISSALGSIMVAPRTLQAIARDRILPSAKANYFLSRGKGKADEPYNATLITVGIALIFVLMGGLNAVAEIISMFFMVTYGSLNLISFLQHFAADPSYRPTFRSKWWISLSGAIACFGLMFFMNPGYAVGALSLMVIFYVVINYYNPDKRNIAVIFQGVIFQVSRRLQVFLQKAEKEKSGNWRPSAVCISENSFERLAAFDLLRWISQRYGFGTYIHKISGYLSKSTNEEARISKDRLIKMAEAAESNIYIDTLISPSYTSAIAQTIQLPGISGTDNNLLLLEYSKNKGDNLKDIVDNFGLIKSVEFDSLILGSSERGFGLKKEIHVWITSDNYDNANLMILLAYIISGHKDWQGGQIKIFALYPDDTCDDERIRLFKLIDDGRLPISKNNIQVIARKQDTDKRTVIADKSQDADLTIIGFHGDALKHSGINVFKGYDTIGNTVFVSSASSKVIE